jgi:tetratricopeptide (TPR) repeat protein
MQSGLVQMARCIVLGALVVSSASAPAIAVMSGGKSEQPPPGDDAYASGKAAFEQEDWQGVIEHMTRAIEERPWHDDAHNLLGFAYRKLGDYDRALAAYDRPELAKGMLERLAAECQRITVGASDRSWQSDCEEWQDLNEAYEAYVDDHRHE